MIEPITLDRVVGWGACYPRERLAALYAEPVPVRDMLTRTDGPWVDVPQHDRIWTAVRPGCLPRPVLLRWLATIVERVMSRVPWSDPRSLEVVDALRRSAAGESVDLVVVRNAAYGTLAYDAACAADALESAASVAAAAYPAVADAAADDVCAYTYDYAATASDAERHEQVADLVAEIDRWEGRQ